MLQACFQWCKYILVYIDVAFFRYTAANMMSLSWDDELAAGAQLWASQCNFNHDTDRNVCRFGVGQNLYIAGYMGVATKNWRAAIGEHMTRNKRTGMMS